MTESRECDCLIGDLGVMWKMRYPAHPRANLTVSAADGPIACLSRRACGRYCGSASVSGHARCSHGRLCPGGISVCGCDCLLVCFDRRAASRRILCASPGYVRGGD